MTRQRLIHFLQRVPLVAWWFLGFFLLLSAYEYGRILHLRPLPHHLWRQTNCLSLTYEFYSGEWNLFKPRLQSLIADGGTTGYSAGEFPIMYYLIGMIWKITGPSEFIYRTIMLALLAWGSWALCRIVHLLMDDRFWGVMIGLLFFTIPTVVYFGIGFLTDVPALSLILAGSLAFLLYLKSESPKQLVLGSSLFALGMLLKISAAMLPLAILFVCIASLVLPHCFPWPSIKRKQIINIASGVAIGLVLMAAWVGYSIHYNNIHGAEYSYQGTWAYWDLPDDEADRAWTFGYTILIHQFFTIPVYILLLVSGAYLALNLRTLPTALILMLTVLILGVTLYLLLWFITLDNHDYYYVEPLVLPFAVILALLWYMRKYWDWAIRSPWAKLLFFSLLAHQALFAMNNIRMKQQDFSMADILGTSGVEQGHWHLTQYWDFEGLLDIEPIARQHGISKDDLVVTVPDNSVCLALYLSGQRGFNEFGGITIRCPQLVERAKQGAKYLYLIEKQPVIRDQLTACLGDPLFVHKEISVYDIRMLASQ